MDSPTERMPIACVHCAKAKAKCDKKVPCSRCVAKQIVCQSRATRRSSHAPSRRHNNLPRPHSERQLHTSPAFQISQFSSPPQDGPMMAPGGFFNPHAITPHTMQHHAHRLSLPDIAHPIQMHNGMYMQQDIEPQLLRNGFSQTPSDSNIPITPVLPNMPHFENFPQMTANFDSEGESPFLSMSSAATSNMDFDAQHMMDFISPPGGYMHEFNDHMQMSGKTMAQTPNHIQAFPRESPMQQNSRLDLEAASYQRPHSMHSTTSPVSPTFPRGLQEPEAVLASQEAWPFFQCNQAEKDSPGPQKTASIYLDGLAQTLKRSDAWKFWLQQLNVHMNDNSLALPLQPWYREKLLAITQGFLHKALDIHKIRYGREDSPGGSPDSDTGGFLMLPPPEAIQAFLNAYVVRHEPYYSCLPGGRLDVNELMKDGNNSKASSLLILLMVASGAVSTATVEARYLASGLTEACRISIFDIIEKDIFQAKDLTLLHSALLFTNLAIWSGDKWHMDIAMGQRGMYLAMVTHANLLEDREVQFQLQACKQDPDQAWANWKESEQKSRLAHSWVIVDQEMGLFSDTVPLLSIANLQAPMPDIDNLYHAQSAIEWLNAFEKIHGTSYQSPASVRDLFSRFVDGELADTGAVLSPMQLRLLLHPLQTQVGQLRQFMACLPKGSRGASKEAMDFQLKETVKLLKDWYALSKHSCSNTEEGRWTTCANLVMYHLISLNAVTSFKCIEQFARREVVIGPFRHASWLQSRCIDKVEETYFHCGQVLRLVRSMPEAVRPPWWSGAVYRVALIGWANSMANAGSSFPTNGHSAEATRQFPIDALTPEDPAMKQYLDHKSGLPMLSRKEGGTLMSMDLPNNILKYCIDMLEEDSSMRLTDGIKRKLRMFVSAWKEN